MQKAVMHYKFLIGSSFLDLRHPIAQVITLTQIPSIFIIRSIFSSTQFHIKNKIEIDVNDNRNRNTNVELL